MGDEEDGDVDEDDMDDREEEEEEQEGLQFGRIIDKEDSSRRDKHKHKMTKRKLLQKAEQFEEYMNDAGEEEKKKILEKKSWNDALAKATGVKVKDNASLLKKSIK